MKKILIILCLIFILKMLSECSCFAGNVNQNKIFLDFYETQIKKTNLIEKNKEFFEKHYNKEKKRCSWEEHSLKIRPKYEYTLDNNKNHIRAKNHFNKILTEKLKLLNFATDGNLISAVRGRGYLNDKRIFYGDDMDPQSFVYVPNEIIKNRSIKIMKNMFPEKSIDYKPKTKEEKDKDYEEKIIVIYTIYRFIKDSNAIFTHYTNNVTRTPNNNINVYLKIKLYSRYCIKGFICEKTHICPVDFIIDDQKSFKNYTNIYGNIRLCNVEGQDVNCLEGSHKYLQNRYGPTYMIPLYAYTYDWSGGKKAPFIDEWNKEWSKTKFKKEHADHKFWEKHNEKYLKKNWKADKF